MKSGKYSLGIGDRFSMQGEAQLKALKLAMDSGIEIIPVWNKSNREHITIGSHPEQTRLAADRAVTNMGWDKPYFLDADHINLDNVDNYIEHADFFTIDVADCINHAADASDIEGFIDRHKKFTGKLLIPGIDDEFTITDTTLRQIARKFLHAVKQAAIIYRHIASHKAADTFLTEVSMDEVIDAQTPIELFFILSALSEEGVPVHTIAPKFTGRFNKGVDYVGDTDLFAKEFEQDILVLDYAIKEFGLPEDLKLSVHSGSDKFSIYPIIGHLIKKYDKGIHVKTAGTTWLEEAIGLALAGGEALDLVKEVYYGALNRYEELTGPYATVIDIDKEALPSVTDVQSWDGEQLAAALRHVPGHPQYNLHFRQLMHVAYKLAAETGDHYLSMLKKYKQIVGEQVAENIYERHLKRLFDL